MKRLGISIYPEHSTLEQDKAYIDLAHKYGFSRIFTCLLSVNGEKEEILQNFKETISYARSKNFEVTVDIAPRIFDEWESHMMIYHFLRRWVRMGYV